MKKIKKLIMVCVLIAELLSFVQPVSAIAQLKVTEKFNEKGNEERISLQEAAIETLEEAVTELIIELPEVSRQSVLLENYLKKYHDDNLQLNDQTTGFIQEKADSRLFRRSDELIQYRNEAPHYTGVVPKDLNEDNPIRLIH